MKLVSKDIEKAYIYLKSYAYYENLNIFLKQRVAEFETNLSKDSFSIISNVINSSDFHNEDIFKKWIDGIDYHFLPKSVIAKEDKFQNDHNKENGLFITNVREFDDYQVSKLNYFINAPIELHIIDILWCLYAGPALESIMTKDSYGNRMHISATDFDTDRKKNNGKSIFKRYIDQYNQWRDQAIDMAIFLSNQGDDVALLTLDLKSYFYHIDLDFDKVIEVIKNYYLDNEELLNFTIKLTKILKFIFDRYNEITGFCLEKTHNECKDKKILPIGLASSSIIGNWYLLKFDLNVGNYVMPSYYGRYVDDIIMVFKRPKIEQSDTIKSFIKNHLKDNIKECDDIYFIDVDSNRLPIQKDKLILQFFDKNHSKASLEVFKQELDERSSAFKFLPSDHINRELDKFAYDILYEGSANKLRSIVGLAENETELAKFLSSHITAHRLCKIDKKDTVLPQLNNFFKGQNALQFYRLWEKIYQYSIIIKDYSFAKNFFNYIESEIKKINFVTEIDDISKKIRSDLNSYNKLSLSISIGLLGEEESIDTLIKKNKIYSIFRCIDGIHNFAWQFRRSNLIRHHLVAWPLANYSTYTGDLTNEIDLIKNDEFLIEKSKIKFSPRFIHFDEWQIFNIKKYFKKFDKFNKQLFYSVKYYNYFGIKIPIYKEEEKDIKSIVKTKIFIGHNTKKNNLKLAIANLVINEKDIESAIRKDYSPNITFARQENLYCILNSALREKSDILIMPEVSVPVSWLPFMVSFSRRHQIGLIFGLEHWVIDDVAYNLIIEVLPFKVSNKYKSCAVVARIKNHYAPAEINLLNNFRLKAGNESTKPNFYYHNISWNGVTFTTYNCFELSDITHRAIFKSEIDLLFACVWNKDTNYYQHILESAVRDLHCYTVHANTSQYGGSCVLRPTKTDSKTMLYVKGGENPCVLTVDIDISSLRSFHFKSTPNDKDHFKHLPPGFNNDLVLKR